MDLEFLFYPRFLFIKKSESFGSWSCCCVGAQEGDCTNIISINQTILCFVDNRKMWIWNLIIFLFISITFYLKFYIPNVPLPQLLISQYSQLFLKWKRSPILYQISAIPYINQIWRDLSKTRLSSYQDISLNCWKCPDQCRTIYYLFIHYIHGWS